MPTQYLLAPNGRWSARDLAGDAAINGYVYTYVNLTRIPKATFSEPSGQNPNENPIRLDSKGEANVYWADDAFYSIEVRDVNNQLIYTQDNYPYTGATGGGAITVYNAAYNFVRNPQFTFWTNSNSYPGITQSQNAYDYIVDDWVFYRSNLNATINITQQTFNLGQTDVPATPVYFFHYECTNVGAGSETYKDIQQHYGSVQALNDTEVFVSFYAKSSSSSTITAVLQQEFGSGGSPSAPVNTTVITANLTNAWSRYTGIVTLPSIAGKTLGTNDDDFLALLINFPLNALAEVDICNVQLHASNSVLDFIPQPFALQEQQIIKIISEATFYTGDVKFTLRTDGDPGWAMCNDGTIGNPLSGSTLAQWNTKALFELIWEVVNNTYAPIYNSDGSVGTRGADAETDYNANKRLSLTRALGRALAVAGTGSGLSARVVGEYVGEEAHALTAAENGPHAHQYQFSQVQSGSGSPLFLRDGGDAGDNTITQNVDASGNGTPHNTMQPTLFLNCMIKL
jgi:hypothetical protein